MPVHQLESVNLATMMDKMREILNRLQERPVPPGNSDSSSLLASYPMGSITYQRPALSQTSLDSTGSGALLETSSATEVPNGIGPRSSFELTSISEQWNGGGGGEGRVNGSALRPTSPAAKSDPGISVLQVRRHSSHTPAERNHSADVEGFNSQDDTSDTSSRTSEEATSRFSTDSPRSRPVLERRHTENFSSTGGHHLPVRRSTLGKMQMGSYANQATSPVSGTGSLRVKQRANPSNSLRLKNRRIQPVTAILPGPPGKSKTIKFVIAGDDDMLSNAAKAFTQLRSKEPNLFWGLDIEFHYLPLSQASSGLSGSVPSSNTSLGSSSGLIDLPEPANENKNFELGGDVLIGRYLSHMDSWYEQNVMLAVHNVMRLLPNVRQKYILFIMLLTYSYIIGFLSY